MAVADSTVLVRLSSTLAVLGTCPACTPWPADGVVVVAIAAGAVAGTMGEPSALIDSSVKNVSAIIVYQFCRLYRSKGEPGWLSSPS